jgi:hypothetical protein
MAVVGVAGCAFLSFLLPTLLGVHAWLMSGDVWWTVNSAQYVSYGGAGIVYAANPFYSALPGFPYLLAPVVALGDALHLSVSHPYWLPHPQMWLLVGPFFFVCGSTAVLGVDYLADSLGIARRRRRWLAAAVTVLVVWPTPGLAGHPEDLLALALACLSFALLFRGRLAGAALVLAGAVIFQTWAGLLIPVLVAASPPGRRVATLLRSSLAPALLGLALLALDFKHASVDLLGQPMPNRGQLLPWHHIAGHVTVTVAGPPATMMAGSTSRSAAVVVALLAALAVHRRPEPRLVMAAAGAALFARGFFETELWPYYLVPAAVFLALLVAEATAGSARRLAAGSAGACLLYLSAPLSYLGIAYDDYLALAVVTACASLCFGAARPAIDAAKRLVKPPYAKASTTLTSSGLRS